jgi:flagellar basal body-associated protein FliL
MKDVNKDKIYLTLVLVLIIVLDMVVAGGILWHGKANFQEVFKNALSK